MPFTLNAFSPALWKGSLRANYKNNEWRRCIKVVCFTGFRDFLFLGNNNSYSACQKYRDFLHETSNFTSITKTSTIINITQPLIRLQTNLGIMCISRCIWSLLKKTISPLKSTNVYKIRVKISWHCDQWLTSYSDFGKATFIIFITMKKTFVPPLRICLFCWFERLDHREDFTPSRRSGRSAM